MDEYKVAVIGIAITILAGSILGIFRGAKYRSQIYREWMPQRADRIIAGLDELAIDIINELHRTIQADYGYTSVGDFWPVGPPPNPSHFREMVDKYERALKYKDKIKSDIKLLMNLGHTLVGSLSMMAIGALMVIFHYSLDLKGASTASIGYALGALAFASIVLALVVHVFLNNRLTNAEVLSDERVQDA